MTSGRLLVIAIVGITAIFAGAQWWFQTRAFYEEVELPQLPVTLADGSNIVLVLMLAEAIDAESSPLRFRACLNVDGGISDRLVEQAQPYPDATPLNGPGWFECYNAAEIGAALEAGEATPILIEPNISRGVDRVMAIYPTGRAYVWHQLNGTLE